MALLLLVLCASLIAISQCSPARERIALIEELQKIGVCMPRVHEQWFARRALIEDFAITSIDGSKSDEQSDVAEDVEFDVAANVLVFKFAPKYCAQVSVKVPKVKDWLPCGPCHNYRDDWAGLLLRMGEYANILNVSVTLCAEDELTLCGPRTLAKFVGFEQPAKDDAEFLADEALKEAYVQLDQDHNTQVELQELISGLSREGYEFTEQGEEFLTTELQKWNSEDEVGNDFIKFNDFARFYTQAPGSDKHAIMLNTVGEIDVDEYGSKEGTIETSFETAEILDEAGPA